MGRSLDHSNFIFPRGYLFGLTLSTAGSSATFSVAVGEALDSSFAGVMTLGTAISKTTSAFVAGSGNGALDTGTIAASTWYWAFLIKNPTTGAVDVCITKAVAATTPVPTLPTGFTLYRYIGSLLTNVSSQWLLFHQLGDEFLWDTSQVDFAIAANGVTTAVLRTLSVPLGVQVQALMKAYIGNTTATFDQLLMTSPDESDQSATGNLFDAVIPTGAANTFNMSIGVNRRTNTSAQVRTRTSTTTLKYSINTYGWIDTRGKLS